MAIGGRYIVKNPHKYRGNAGNVIFRSTWEYQVLKMLDNNPAVEWFSSEEVVIPYRSPVDGRIHRYFVDILYKSTTGAINCIEIKPFIQTQPPKQPSRITKQYVNKVKTYTVNQAKWEAAKLFCEERNWEFKIWTEQTLKKFGLLT